VCAHWNYKEDGQEDTPYTQKMNWLRRVVEWQDETRDRVFSDPIGEELRERITEERIFVYTPKGHVLDLTTGATPVDFAYRVHTQVGHRCRGARIDGREVALNTPLETGQRVEIISGVHDAPERKWLDADLGFAKTARAREKIQDYFRSRDPAVNEMAGRKMLEQALGRLAVTMPGAKELSNAALRLGFADTPRLEVCLAIGDCAVVDVIAVLVGARGAPAQLSLLPEDAGLKTENFSIDISARDREGLLLDITSFLKQKHVSLVSNSGSVNADTSIATITAEVCLEGLVQLSTIIDGLRQIPDVIEVRRIGRQAFA
jgi:GTP pyrophosphokinase